MANILVVDDEVDMEPMIRQRFRRDVRSGKMTFHFARDGIQALDILDENPAIALVITDINMPRMDGLTLLERLSERVELNAKAIIVSAYGDLANIRAGMNRGAFDFVTKPIAFDDLERTINRALEKGRMEQLAREAHARVLEVEKEFDWARRVQMGILPPPWRQAGPEEVVGFMRSAREVGGDAYDFMLLDENHVGFAIADVVGKGIAAAMMAAVTHAYLRAVATDALEPAACLAKVNRLMAANNPEMLYVTLLYCVLDRRTGKMTFASAGHPWPLLIDINGAVEPLSCRNGIPIGIKEDAEWANETITLRPGERLFLFTDGLTEANNESNEFFGEIRLRQSLEALAKAPPDVLIPQLIAQIDDFASPEMQADDMTCLLLDWRGDVRVQER